MSIFVNPHNQQEERSRWNRKLRFIPSLWGICPVFNFNNV